MPNFGSAISKYNLCFRSSQVFILWFGHRRKLSYNIKEVDWYCNKQ